MSYYHLIGLKNGGDNVWKIITFYNNCDDIVEDIQIYQYSFSKKTCKYNKLIFVKVDQEIENWKYLFTDSNDNLFFTYQKKSIVTRQLSKNQPVLSDVTKQNFVSALNVTPNEGIIIVNYLPIVYSQ